MPIVYLPSCDAHPFALLRNVGVRTAADADAAVRRAQAEAQRELARVIAEHNAAAARAQAEAERRAAEAAHEAQVRSA